MSFLLIVAWLWVLGGLLAMVLTAPTLFAARFVAMYWWKRRVTRVAPYVVARGRYRRQIILFAKGWIYFVLGLIGVIQPGTRAAWMTISFACLALMPFLLGLMGFTFLLDDRQATDGTG